MALKKKQLCNCIDHSPGRKQVAFPKRVSKETLKKELFTRGRVDLMGQEIAKNPGISCSRRKLLPFLGLKGKEEGAVIGILHACSH